MFSIFETTIALPHLTFHAYINLKAYYIAQWYMSNPVVVFCLQALPIFGG